jgi:hypothetical protein
MKSCRKRGRANELSLAALAFLFMATPAFPDVAPLKLHVPDASTPHFGIPASWPRLRLELPAVDAPAPPAPPTEPPRDPAEGPREGMTTPAAVAEPARPAPAPPPEPKPTSPPPSTAAELASPASHATTLQPSLVERGLLTRTFQRVALGDLDVSGAERRDLALRALMSLQSSPGQGPTGGDPLRQIGLERRRFGSALSLVEGRAVGMEFATVRGQGGEVRRQQFSVGSSKGPSLHLSMLNVDSGFSRLQDLTAEERAWVGGMRGMSRLEFGGDRLALAGGKADLGLLQLGDGDARAHRWSLGFTGGRWSVRALSQRADDGFKRLGDLTEADRKLFGQERGIARDSLDLGYALSGNRKLTASSLTLRAAAGSAERRQLEYLGGPNLQLRLQFGRVDSSFDRLGDLLEPDRNALSPLRGTRWSDLTANFRAARWLTTENRWYRSTSLDTGGQTSELRNLWTLQLAPKSKLILLRDLLETPTGASTNRHTLTQSVRLEQWLTRSLFFTGLRETVQQATDSAPDANARRLALHLNTAPSLKLQASADYTDASSLNGRDERVLQWTLGLPLRKGLTLQAKGDRRAAEGAPDAHSLSLGLNGQIAHAWDLAFALNTTDPARSPGTRDLGLRLTYAGLRDSRLFKETRLVLGVGDAGGLPSAVPVIVKKNSPPPPARPGPPTRQVRSLMLETKLNGLPFALGYNAAAGTAGGFAYRLATDPRRRLQIEALREVRDLGHTSLVARERYACHARIARTTQLALSYERQPEQSPGKLLLGHTQTRAEARTKVAGLDLSAAATWDQDRASDKTSTLASFALAGSVDSGSSISLSYTGRTGGADRATPDSDIRISYEHKPEEALLLAFRADWRVWDHKRSDELAWQLDLSAVF